MARYGCRVRSMLDMLADKQNRDHEALRLLVFPLHGAVSCAQYKYTACRQNSILQGIGVMQEILKHHTHLCCKCSQSILINDIVLTIFLKEPLTTII